MNRKSNTYYRDVDRYGEEKSTIPTAKSLTPVYHDGADWVPAIADNSSHVASALKLDTQDIPLDTGLVEIVGHGFPLGQTAFLDWRSPGTFFFPVRGQFYAVSGAPLGTPMQGLFKAVTEDIVQLLVTEATASFVG